MADNPVWDEEKHELRVMDEKCSTCIFGPGSIVTGRRTRNMVAQASEDPLNGHIICHKTVKAYAGNVPGAICRGFWDRYFKHTILGRLAQLEDLIVWWPEPKETGK